MLEAEIAIDGVRLVRRPGRTGTGSAAEAGLLSCIVGMPGNSPVPQAGVVIADRHALVRECLRLLIDFQPDMTVLGEAADGLQALDLVAQLQPRVLLLEMQLPGLSGLEVTRQVVEAYPEVRVAVLTQREAPACRYEALAAGASAYLLKRGAASELMRAIRSLARGRMWSSPAAEAASQPMRSPPELSPRQLQIVRFIAAGFGNREIAGLLGISVKTVQAHRGHLLKRLDLHDRVDLVKYAVRKGLLRLDVQT